VNLSGSVGMFHYHVTGMHHPFRAKECKRLRTARALVLSLRPRQWTKNLIVFAPLIFAGELTSPSALLRAFAVFAVFCAASGAVYLANDLVDLELDSVHAVKKSRPLASGMLHPSVALAALLLLTASALAGSFALGTTVSLVTTGFLTLQAVYSLWLKHQVIIDVMSIAAGFVLRTFAGALVIGVSGSPWLYTCAALLALFLGLAKRRHELVLLEAEARSHRPSLHHYSAPLIDAMLSSTTAAIIIAYALYTFFSTTGMENQYLMLTVPFVVYGLFRYLYLVHKESLGGSPEEVLLTDKPLIANTFLWLVCATAALYFS